MKPVKRSGINVGGGYFSSMAEAVEQTLKLPFSGAVIEK